MANYDFDGMFDLDDALSMPLTVDSISTVGSLTNETVSTADDRSMETTSFVAVSTPHDAVCSVCTEVFEAPLKGGRQIPCGHVYHAHCISAWLSVRNSCPLCRLPVFDQKRAHLKPNC